MRDRDALLVPSFQPHTETRGTAGPPRLLRAEPSGLPHMGEQSYKSPAPSWTTVEGRKNTVFPKRLQVRARKAPINVPRNDKSMGISGEMTRALPGWKRRNPARCLQPKKGGQTRLSRAGPAEGVCAVSHSPIKYSEMKFLAQNHGHGGGEEGEEASGGSAPRRLSWHRLQHRPSAETRSWKYILSRRGWKKVRGWTAAKTRVSPPPAAAARHVSSSSPTAARCDSQPRTIQQKAPEN